MTDEELNAIKARLDAALPGPWKGFTFRRPIDGNCYIIVREDDPHVIAATLVPQYGDNDTAVMLLHARADMDALVAEVERLREEAHELRLMVEEAALAENLNAGDAKKERAAVVAWLRYQAEVFVDDERALCRAADAIERGEHRREEEK